MGTYRDTYADIHEFEIMVGSELRRTWLLPFIRPVTDMTAVQ